jgi:hypothetical protein
VIGPLFKPGDRVLFHGEVHEVEKVGRLQLDYINLGLVDAERLAALHRPVYWLKGRKGALCETSLSLLDSESES